MRPKKPKPPKKRTPEQYRRLDCAMVELLNWQKEITDDLTSRGLTWKIFSEFIDSVRRVHEQGD
jgi:hypothetical protein